MNNDKTRIAVFEVALLVCLLFLLIFQNQINDFIAAGVIAGFALCTKAAIHKVSRKSLRSSEAITLMTIFSILYVGGYYLIGIIANSMGNTAYGGLSYNVFINYVLPTTIIIVASEFIRYHFIAANLTVRRNGKSYNLSIPLMFICTTLIDVLLYIRIYAVYNYDDFLIAIGLVLFSSISSNLFFNYSAKRYGMTGNIIFRLVTGLYVYILPVAPDIYVYLQSFMRMVFPYFAYYILDRALVPADHIIGASDRRKSIVAGVLIIVLMTAFTMLVSCKFKYGALVIATDSMTGTLDRGTAVVFESYDNQIIREGQIILFEKDGVVVVHRVVKVEQTAEGDHYITKGDANESNDSGYAVGDDVIGLAQFGVAYVGWPTLWIRSLFNA